MARITPSTGTATDVSQLEDDEPYVVEIIGMSFDESDHPQYGRQKRLRLTLAFVDENGQANRDDTILDWVGLKLGQKQDGEIAKLRQLLNALAREPKETTVAWFDDDTMEWSYDGEIATGRLEEGQRVVIRGELVMKTGQDGTPVRRYRVKKYQPLNRKAGGPKGVSPSPSNGGSPAGRANGRLAQTAATASSSQSARRTVDGTDEVDPDDIPF